MTAITATLRGFPWATSWRYFTRSRSAEQGDSSGQNSLGRAYRDGLGVPQDHAEAVRWFRLSAEQEDADALYNLGLAYRDGQGVPQDDVAAHMWLSLAAARNHEGATAARDALAERMSPQQIAEAASAEQEWAEAHR